MKNDQCIQPVATDWQQEIAELAPWFHNLHLPDGTQTAPDHPLKDFPGWKWKEIAGYISEDLNGWHALDIGCNAGFYSFELARRGARVTAIDVDPRYLAQARWACRIYNLENQIEFRQQQIYDLARGAETYDLILFMGVFYHLRYPLLGLDIVARKLRRQMIFQTLTTASADVTEEIFTDTRNRGRYDHVRGIADREPLSHSGWARLSFIEHEFVGDRTNWWIPNTAGVEAMLRSAGLKITERPGHEVYVCEPDPANPSPVATWDEAELLSATGQAR